MSWVQQQLPKRAGLVQPAPGLCRDARGAVQPEGRCSVSTAGSVLSPRCLGRGRVPSSEDSG